MSKLPRYSKWSKALKKLTAKKPLFFRDKNEANKFRLAAWYRFGPGSVSIRKSERGYYVYKL